MSKQTQETFAKLAADVILAEFPNLNRQSVVNYLKKEHAAFETENLLARVSNAGTPHVPAKDNPPPAGVPDPAETEGTKSTKESTPDYNEFLNGMSALEKSGKTLFDLDDEDEEMEDRRQDALRDVDAVADAIRAR